MNIEAKADDSAIRLQGLSKSFASQHVLDSIDLRVRRGETLTVLGRSGSGKSVLLKLIIGLQKPDAGSIEVDGQDITRISLTELNNIRKTIGFLFQQAALYDSLTVEENVAFPLRRHTTLRTAERTDRVRELLARVGMEAEVRKMPAQLSGGMKKRVGLARSLALDPKIMLLDDPTAGLDPITTAEINELIQDLQQERQMSFVVVTHDMLTVNAVANRVVMLYKGRLVFDGAPGEMKDSGHPFVSKFLREAEGRD